MKHWDTVAIVGVGLIGGSIGLDLQAKRIARRVIGVGRRASSLKVAKAAGLVTETTLKLDRAAAEADLIIVCTPVARIVEDVQNAAAAARPNTLITDAGSTKRSIVHALDGVFANGITFVGGHPIAGSEKSGPTAAMRDLYKDRVVVVTPTDKTPPQAVRTIETFWKQLGARVMRMSPEAHDTALAVTSHVPHVVASALAASTPSDVLPLAAGGWHDTTRIAASDGTLWSQILCDNRERVLETLDEFAESLDMFRSAIENRDPAGLEKLWAVGKQRRELAASLATRSKHARRKRRG